MKNKFLKPKPILFSLVDITIMGSIGIVLWIISKTNPTSIIVHGTFTSFKILLAVIVTYVMRYIFGIYRVIWAHNEQIQYLKLFIADAISFVIVFCIGVIDRKISLGFGFTLVLYLFCFIGTIISRIIYQQIYTYESKKESKKVQFSPPDITDLEINEVVDALKSGWITTGPRTKQFEKNIADYIGVNKCVCLNSQTACAEMALRLLGVGPGDEVITTAYTYTASASVIDHVGAKIVLVDCEKDSFDINYKQVEEKITPKTKAIIPVDLGGIPCDYDRLYEIVERKRDLFTPSDNDIQKSLGRIAICSDSAHSFGGKYKDKMCGNIADFSSFSFHAVKNLTTAEGGCLSWKPIDGISDDEIYRRLQLLSLHGQNKDALAKTQVGAWEYDIIGTYYKCNMTDIVAAVGLKQLERYPSLLDKRRKINEKYDKAFVPMGLEVMNHYNENHTSTGHLYLVRIPNITEQQRNEIIIKMAEMGVTCNVHYKPLPMHTAYKNMGFDIKDYPNSYDKYHNLISLPNHTLLTNADVDRVIECFKLVLKDYL